MAEEQAANTEAEIEVVEDGQSTETETETTEEAPQEEDTQSTEEEAPKKTTNKSGSKLEALKAERSKRQAAEAKLKEYEDAKLAEEGKYKELYEASNAELKELKPDADAWKAHKEEQEKLLDTEVGELTKTLGKDFLSEKKAVIDGFSNKESLKMYLQDQVELSGKGDFKSKPKGGFGMRQESSTTKIEDHKVGNNFNAGGYLLAQFESKQQ